MPSFPPDRLEVEVQSSDGAEAATFDRFTSFQITLDITAPSEASFEMGDERTWRSLEKTVAPGTRYSVRLNGRLLLAGRVEANDVPFDAQGGASVRFTVRSKLSDAMYASADPEIEVKDSTLLDFILALYEPLGYVETDFLGLQDQARSIVTGRFKGRGLVTGTREFKRLPLKEARVQPPETIYAAADRHLRRFGLMHWDGPDGTIVVGAPDNDQEPLYFFNSYRASELRRLNNVLSVTRAQDWSSVPSFVQVVGVGSRRDFSRIGVQGAAADEDVFAAGFHRPVFIHAEGVKTAEAAVNAANRELSARRKSKDSINVEVDGFSYRDGTRRTNYYPDTVAHFRTDVAGGDLGAYYMHRVELSRDAAQGDVARLSMLKRGLWVLHPDLAGEK